MLFSGLLFFRGGLLGKRHLARGLMALALSFAAICLFRAPVSAAGTVGNGTPASCDGNAIQTALNGGGLVQFNCGAADNTIIANTYVIQDDTIIDGAGKITLDGEDLRQIFLVQPNTSLELRNIALKDGNFSSGGCVYGDSGSTVKVYHATFTSCAAMPGDGGAIYSVGTVISEFSQFTGNSANDDGGAIFALGTVTVHDSLLANNTAASSGAAIRLNGGTLDVSYSLLTGNVAAETGGGIDIATGTVTISNSTFYDNRADQGGGIFSAGGSTDTEVKASTMIANRANAGGAIFYFGNGAFTFQSSIAAESLDLAGTSPALECDGPSITTQGYNLIGDNSCFSGEPTDTKDIDNNGGAKLGALADNGGFTQTLLPDADSPALGEVAQAVCTPLDQRRALRTAPCDIGAVERGALFPSLYLPIARQ